MSTKRERTYLAWLVKSLTQLLALLQKEKPGFAYSQAEIRAFSTYPGNFIDDGYLECVSDLRSRTGLIYDLQYDQRDHAIFFVQLYLSQAIRLSEILKEIERDSLQSILRELRRYDITELKRSALKPGANPRFRTYLNHFLDSGDIFNDHFYENISELAGLYTSTLPYYLIYWKEIFKTKDWYDFLCISSYMLYGRKLEILQILKLRKR